MPLELRIENGTVRPFWYGRFKINGKRLCQNLKVKVAGTPPASFSLKEQGDEAFEVSREAAQKALDDLISNARGTRDSVRLVEKLYEIKTGEAIGSVKLDELAEEWAKIPRRRTPDERYAGQCQSTLRRFVAFVRQENSKAEEIAQVSRAIGRAFLDAEVKRGVSGKTWNDTLKLLRATFKYLLPAGAINPFSDTPTKDTETVFRVPFTPEELKAIIDVAKKDEFIRPILVTGMCTAMRRGDCCLLKGDDVDMQKRFIAVKTAKTGVTVSIPIFPMLYDELSKRAVKPGKYVFPEQAAMYLENPDGITWRVKKVLAVALRGMVDDNRHLTPANDSFAAAQSVLAGPAGDTRIPFAGRPLKSPVEAERVTTERAELPEVSAEEVLRRGHAYIDSLPDSKKKEHMKVVFDLYARGKKLCEAVEESGVSKGSASNYLNQVEGAIGCRVVRGRNGERSVTALLKDDKSVLGAKREGGRRRASVRDFHSFRVTWVTLALTAGVPLELVQKVTGHKTTDIVLKHYFQPGREAFRQALQSAMPKLLTNGQKSPKDELREILESMKGKAGKNDATRALAVLARI